MNESEALRWQLHQYKALLTTQIGRIYNALEELQRTTLLLIDQDRATNEEIENWLNTEGFAVDEDGFFQSLPLLAAYRNGSAPPESISFSWGKHLKDDPAVRRRLYIYRGIGQHLKHIHDRLGDVGWIYYQDHLNISLQYPYIDQRTAIPWDFDWKTYHTFISVNPRNNPERAIRWTPPTIDYAGEGMIVSVSIPVWQANTFLGLWSADLPLRYLYRDFATTKVLPGQTQFISDINGMLMLHEKLNADIDQSKGSLFLHSLKEQGGDWEHLDYSTILKEGEGIMTLRENDRSEFIYYHCHVPDVEWVLFSGLPKAAMEEAAAQRLRLAFQQIADGNFSYRIESNPTSALSTLVDEFNKMSSQLSQAEQNRREIEKQLLQAQKMEAIGRLAGGVAHDQNNMLNVILGYTEMAFDQVNEDSQLYEDLKEINDAARRSMDLTRQLLAFARRQSIAPKVLDLNDTIKNMLNMFQRMIGEDIELIWIPGEHVWPIEIDPSQIDQILANLCVNARDAISGVGKIVIETCNTELDEKYCALHQGFKPGKYTQLSVSDDGEGMNSNILNNIFEPFFSTKATGKGTGLGLSTVYGIMKQNKGFINVYSELGHGTTFKLYFPRILGKSIESYMPVAAETVMGNNETILLVEDEPATLKLTEKMLKQLGYKVLAMNSPFDAVVAARTYESPIDMMVTDVIMPDLNGHDLAKRLRQFLPELKVLYMSGYTADVIVHRGVLEKDVVFLQKPFSKKELAGKVKEVLTTAKKP